MEEPVTVEPLRNSRRAAGSYPFGAQEPFPLQDAATFWRTVSQLATIAMAVIQFGAFIYFARSLLVPIMIVALFAIGLLVFPNLFLALIAPAFLLSLTFLEGHFFTPNIVGRQMLMNSLAVFLSLAFWTWMWGPIGAFLSTPILIMTTGRPASHLSAPGGRLAGIVGRADVPGLGRIPRSASESSKPARPQYWEVRKAPIPEWPQTQFKKISCHIGLIT